MEQYAYPLMLRRLRDCGLVRFTRDGTTLFYELVDDHTDGPALRLTSGDRARFTELLRRTVQEANR